MEEDDPILVGFSLVKKEDDVGGAAGSPVLASRRGGGTRTTSALDAWESEEAQRIMLGSIVS